MSKKKKIKNPSCCLKEENFYDRLYMCFSELITCQQTCLLGHVSPSPGRGLLPVWSVRNGATELWVSCGEQSFLCIKAAYGTPLQYSCLENPMDGGPWSAAVHGVARSWTRLSDFTFTFHVHALEKEMATHSSVLAWRIPGTGEPGGLPSVGLHRVEHD